MAGEQGWAIRDAVVHLRARGMRGPQYEHKLPGPGIAAWWIGASAECALQLNDPRNLVSRLHARLERELGKWVVRDNNSTNGTRLDGIARDVFDLTPGVEVGVGSFEFVAESPQLIALRNLLDRWIGWAPARHADVDDALRALRVTAAVRSSLVLRGDGDLAPIAARLHRETVGDRRPFILAGAERDGVAKFYAAANGTLCFQAGRLPLDWPDVVEAVRAQRLDVQTIFLANLGPDPDADAAIAQLRSTSTIELPRLAQRRDEIQRIIEEYALDAANDLGAAVGTFRPADWDRLLSRRWKDFSTLAKDVRRLVALRSWHLVEAAARLGITHGALSKWATRRRFASF